MKESSVVLMPEAALSAGSNRVGGKALGLGRLVAAGAPVPPWFVVAAEAYQNHVEGAGLAADIAMEFEALAQLDSDQNTSLAIIEEASKRMRHRVESAPLMANMSAALEEALSTLGSGPFAVRSSMVGEDSDTHSFAGQLDSFLFQRDLEDVQSALRRCWGSALSARVISYRLRAGLKDVPKMSVVVQQMIDGQVSGVVFTAHPISGRRDQVLLTAAWGQGEGIVSGLCNTDEFVWNHGGGEDSVRIACKDIKVVANPEEGEGTVEIDVPAEEQEVRCLAEADVAKICTESLRIAAAFGAPQDIEWTLDAGALHIVQARPITSLPEAENIDGPELVFDNSNIQESYCGVTTPLTFSFASEAYANVYTQTMRVAGLPERVIQSHEGLLRNLLGLVRGRVYYNINNWYRGLLLLPSFGRNKADMEAMMGLTDPVDLIEDETLSLTERLARLPRLLLTTFKLLTHFRRLAVEVPQWIAEFKNAYGSFDRRTFNTATFSELMGVVARLESDILDRWHTPIVNDFYVMMCTGKLRRLMESTGREDMDALTNRLMSGEDGIESTEPVRMLMRMAKIARGDAALSQAIMEGTPVEALSRIQEAHPVFSAEIEDYVERYGDRCMGELKLETISLREEPDFVVLVLRNYLDRPDLDPDALASKEKEGRVEAEKILRQSLSPWKRIGMQRTLHHAREAVKNREAMRLARTRLFGLYRDAYRALGDRLHVAGRLDAPRDIFYLTTQELWAYHEGRAVCTDLGGIARVRKAEFVAYETQDLPHQFKTMGPVYHGNRYRGPERPPREAGDGKILHGIGCYPGVVESQVKVILSPRDELSVNGLILTTMRTDPGWAPLFPTCSGLLIERGSTLSHSAVIARELGIPAVVGVTDLLQIVVDGERVRLDGEKGEVERLEVEAEGDGAADMEEAS